MFKFFATVFIICVSWLTYCYSETTVNITCTSCSTYVMTINSTSNYSVTCPTGTVCYTGFTTNSTLTSNTMQDATTICSSSYPCDGVVCNRYAVFPSSTNCQQYHICRYISGYGTYVVSTVTCPGSSKFDQMTNKCTLNTNVSCYSPTA